MLSDGLALGMAAFASRLTRAPVSGSHSYGLVRAEVLAAAFNGLLMLAVIVGIVVESVSRLLHPTPVEGEWVMLIALIGLIVNVLSAVILARAGDGLNVRAAMIHVLGDLLGSVAAILAGAIIWFTGWLPADPILSLLVVLSILVSTVRLLRETLHVLMEGVPHHVDLASVGQSMSQVEGVKSVHDLHIWSLGASRAALSAHIDLDSEADWTVVLARLKRLLRTRFHIDHVTLQPEVHRVAPRGVGDRSIPIRPIH
jgi:cobalt-zinc-cadmium efflux system protein